MKKQVLFCWVTAGSSYVLILDEKAYMARRKLRTEGNKHHCLSQECKQNKTTKYPEGT